MTTKKPSAVTGLRCGLGTVQGEPAPPGSHAPDPAEVVPPPRPEKPVRFTLDLDQAHHAFLKRFAVECGAGTGGAQVLRALLDELQEDPDPGRAGQGPDLGEEVDAPGQPNLLDLAEGPQPPGAWQGNAVRAPRPGPRLIPAMN
jgi:hypothetical protein